MRNIVNDPGHGGDDRKNVGPTNYVEADGVLDIVNSVTETLIQYKDLNPIQTRTLDATMSLTSRGLFGGGAEAFFSHHTNASTNLSVRGCEVFYSVDLPDDKVFAEKLSAAIASRLGIPNRGAKLRESKKHPGEDFYTVMDVAQDSGCPHVFLIEYAFHSNYEDEALLKDPEIRKDLGVLVGTMIAEQYGFELAKKELSAWDVERLAAAEWVSKQGISDGKRPKDAVTREEQWVMMHRFYQLLEEGVNSDKA